MMFNLPATEQFSKSGEDAQSGYATKIFAAMQSTAGDAVCQKRTIWYGTSAGDRKGFNKSVTRINKWGFERIIPCHGDVIEKEGKRIWEKIFGWHLEAAKTEGN
jgi:hypothetical protein